MLWRRPEYDPVQGAYVDTSAPPDPFIASLRADRMLAGDACPVCGGRGTVRVRDRQPWDRATCTRCGGDGHLKPRPER